MVVDDDYYEKVNYEVFISCKFFVVFLWNFFGFLIYVVVFCDE